MRVRACPDRNKQDGFGSNFISAGDVNGDGYDDILINASNFLDPLFLGRGIRRVH